MVMRVFLGLIFAFLVVVAFLFTVAFQWGTNAKLKMEKTEEAPQLEQL